MTLEIMEAMIKRIQNSGAIGSRPVYIEEGVPKLGEYPQTTIAFQSVAPTDPTHGGPSGKVSHLYVVNSIQSVNTVGAIAAALAESDSIIELFHAKQFSVTLASGSTVTVKGRWQGGNLTKDMDTQEWISQHTYEIIHD